MSKSGTPFYLTGGTALSRIYLNHRYSDDLDLFVNSDDNYSKYIDTLYFLFKAEDKNGNFYIDENRLVKSKMYTQFFLKKQISGYQIDLKIDIVNDVARHCGSFYQDKVLGKIDSWENILSNKLTSIFRYEPKDIADIWAIAKKYSFSWRLMLEEAKSKEVGIDPIVIKQILSTFPVELLEKIKFINSIDKIEFISDLLIIANEIFLGLDNSLAKE